jgi:hypothetical protein
LGDDYERAEYRKKQFSCDDFLRTEVVGGIRVVAVLVSSTELCK